MYCFHTNCRLRQAFDAQVVGDYLFESQFELFKVVLQDRRAVFMRCSPVKRDRGFFFCGQGWDFLHQLLRRVVSQESQPEENDWFALLGVWFKDSQTLSISKFIEKTEFRTKAKRAAKGPINVEREEHEKAKTDAIASAVMGEMFNPHVSQERVHFRHVCCELSKHLTFKSALMDMLAGFEYSVLFTLPRDQAVDCYSRLFQSFCIRGWSAKDVKNVQ